MAIPAINTVLGPIADSDFLHPNNLSVAAVEQIFADACTLYNETRQALS